MAIYEYIAKTRQGSEVSGTLQAETESAAVRSLDERELFPVSLVEKATGGGGLSGRGIKSRQLGLVYGQLSDLLIAGVPLLRGMETILRTLQPGAMRSALQKVGEDVAAGESLADAMAAQPTKFPPLHVAMVRAGERGGFLEQVLADLAQFMESQDELRSKVRGALIYPVILVTVGIGVVCFLLLWVVPKFRAFFKTVDLPLPSQVLFLLSDAITQHWPIALAAIFGAIGGLVWFVNSGGGKAVIDRVTLKVPVVGRAIQMVAITRFCKILGTLLQAGVPILQSLQISRDAAGLEPLGVAIDEAGENVKAGEPLHEPLRRSGMFPAEILEMIAVAEESNQMEKTLLRIAETVERRTNRQVELAVRMIEPLILILIAAAVGFVAMGLLLPIFRMVSTLG